MNHTETASSVSTTENAYTYFAFISYKREDEKWARWLKRNLQLYRLPAKTHKKHPDLKRRCSPVFLDKTNLMPGELDSGLSSEVQSAKYLIVICSRAAKANSKYLDAELKYFLEGDGDINRVIPFIVDKSDHPVEECFPDYLAKLCEEKNIVGVSIYDDSKRSALLRIVAAMLGIKREELESDDMRRRRKQRLATMFLAVMLIAGAWKCWDYFVPKEKYYLDYTEVYGVPVGIQELSSREIQSMHAHYTIKSSRGKVEELRYENSAGKLQNNNRTVLITKYSKAHYAYEEDKLSAVDYYDKNDHLITHLEYHGPNTVDLSMDVITGENGEAASYAAPLSTNTTALADDSGNKQSRKSNISRYCISYDKDGYTKEIRFAANQYNDFAMDEEGVSGFRYERDALGRVIRMSYLTFVGIYTKDAVKSSNYAVIGRRDGQAALEFVYDDHFDDVEIRFLDAAGMPILHPAYGCIIRSQFINHNKTRQSFYTAEGEPYLDSFGIAGYDSVYDERGYEIKRSYFGVDGQPVLQKSCYAGWESTFDERGNQIKCSYFGTDGKPVLCRARQSDQMQLLRYGRQAGAVHGRLCWMGIRLRRARQ